MYEWQIPPGEQVIALTLAHDAAMASFGETLQQVAQVQPILHPLGYSLGWAPERVAYYVATSDLAASLPLLETMCGLHQLEYPGDAPAIVVLGTGWQTLAQPTCQTGRYVKQTSGPGRFGIVTLRFAPAASCGDITLDVQPLLASPAWRDVADRQQYEDQMFASLMHWALGGRPETLLAGLHVTAESARYHDVDSSIRDFYTATRLACDQALQAVGTVPACP